MDHTRKIQISQRLGYYFIVSIKYELSKREKIAWGEMDHSSKVVVVRIESQDSELRFS